MTVLVTVKAGLRWRAATQRREPDVSPGFGGPRVLSGGLVSLWQTMDGRVTIRLDLEEAEALALMARRKRHSLSAEVRQAIQAWMERAAAAERAASMTPAELDAYLLGPVPPGDERPIEEVRDGD